MIAVLASILDGAPCASLWLEVRKTDKGCVTYTCRPGDTNPRDLAHALRSAGERDAAALLFLHEAVTNALRVKGVSLIRLIAERSGPGGAVMVWYMQRGKLQYGEVTRLSEDRAVSSTLRASDGLARAVGTLYLTVSGLKVEQEKASL